MMGQSQRPLDGFKVVDLSAVWAMPGAAMYLADQGADVIKIEPPTGDIGRQLLAMPAIAGRSRAHWMLNRNKRSVALDLKQAEARAVLLRLVESCDVVMHNFRPGAAERIGCGYDQVAAVNERAVYASFTAGGAQGPKRNSRGYDLLLQARAGILSRRRSPDGEPQPAGLFAVDMGSSMLVAFAVTLALLQRERTGKGQLVEGSLLQTALALQNSDLVRLIRHDEASYDSAMIDWSREIETVGQPDWAVVIDHLSPNLPETNAVKGALRQFGRRLLAVPEIMRSCGVDDDIIEFRNSSIEQNANQLLGIR